MATQGGLSDAILTDHSAHSKEAGPGSSGLALFLGLLLVEPCAHAQTAEASIDKVNECVILLHGLARTKQSMSKVGDVLEAAGYRIANVGYASRDARIEVLADDALTRGVERCREMNTHHIHIVTHSMGGILLRYYLTEAEIPSLRHVVMMAPPNQGSEVVDDWKDRPGFKSLNGPAGMQLGTDENSIPAQLGPVDFSLGVIAGTATVNPILSRSLPDPDDGKVSLAATKVNGMRDFIAVPYSHTFMMNAEDVHGQILHFLHHGRFKHD